VNVLVDTSVWSLALRRSTSSRAPEVAELIELVRDGRVVMMGVVRQELLSGIRNTDQFESIRHRLRAFPDLELEITDHEQAATFFNRCRAKGIQGSTIDFLLCAAASRRKLSVFTTDGDFASYARVVPVVLHQTR
jgi:predicted nucleic acid-binding protein